MGIHEGWRRRYAIPIVIVLLASSIACLATTAVDIAQKLETGSRLESYLDYYLDSVYGNKYGREDYYRNEYPDVITAAVLSALTVLHSLTVLVLLITRRAPGMAVGLATLFFLLGWIAVVGYEIYIIRVTSIFDAQDLLCNPIKAYYRNGKVPDELMEYGCLEAKVHIAWFGIAVVNLFACLALFPISLMAHYAEKKKAREVTSGATSTTSQNWSKA